MYKLKNMCLYILEINMLSICTFINAFIYVADKLMYIKAIIFNWHQQIPEHKIIK